MTVNVIGLEHPRGYPAEYVSDFVAGDGTRFTVRPIRGDDEPLMVDFHRQLSTDTVYRRYFGIIKFDARVAHERLLLRCSIDYSKEMALVAEYADTENGRHIAGVGRFIRNPAGNSAEVAFVVADAFQHHGLGSYLLQQLTAIARREGVAELEAEVLSDNYNMKNLFHRAGFSFSQPDGGTVTARLKLRQEATSH
jgi:acetyltransferase